LPGGGEGRGGGPTLVRGKTLETRGGKKKGGTPYSRRERRGNEDHTSGGFSLGKIRGEKKTACGKKNKWKTEVAGTPLLGEKEK